MWAKDKHQSKTSYKHWDDKNLPIKDLIYACEEYIVFLDYDLAIDWKTIDETYGNFSTGWPKIQSRYTALEDSLCDGASRSSIRRAHRLIAEGVARGLDRNLKEAEASLDNAERYISARNRELSQIAYLNSAGWMTVIICLTCLVCWLERSRLWPVLGPALSWMIIYAAGGALGAFLSVLLKRGQPLDPNTESKGHSTEARARILVGVCGAVLTALAVRSGFLYPQLAATPALLLGVCAFAGLSERLVPDLTRRIETKGAAALPETATSNDPAKPTIATETPPGRG